MWPLRPKAEERLYPVLACLSSCGSYIRSIRSGAFHWFWGDPSASTSSGGLKMHGLCKFFFDRSPKCISPDEPAGHNSPTEWAESA